MRADIITPKRLLVVVGVLLIAALALVAVNLWPPRGGLSEADAVGIARAHTDPGATYVRSADLQHNFDARLGARVLVHKWAWVVTFNGQWHLLCSASNGGCDPSTEWVAIDYDTGEWTASQYSYPGPTH